VHRALAHVRPPRFASEPADESVLLSHLESVYAFALTLTGDDPEHAAALTEAAFATAHDDVWSTLGGYGLRERLLARCVAAFNDAQPPEATRHSVASPDPSNRSGLMALLFVLPWRQRAAIALIDHLGLSYADAAAVLDVRVDAFREFLRRGRCLLFDAYRVAGRHRSSTPTRRRSPA
jgi:sigma-70-like protein